MNLIGKIFVGLIVSMSIFVFSLSLFLWNSQASWRQIAEEKDNLIKSINEENQKIKSVNDKLNAQLDAVLGAEEDNVRKSEEGSYYQFCNPLVTETNNISNEYQTRWNNRIAKETELQEQIFNISANNSVITENRGLIEKFSDELKVAQNIRAVFVKDLTETMAEKYKLDYMITNFQSKNEKLVNNYDIAIQVLNDKGLDLDTNLFKMKPSYPVQGQIDEIQKGNHGLIMITIGSNDGLIPNHILSVSRSGSFLGCIKVLTTEPNRAVCQIIPEYRRGTMREGDLVSSNIIKDSDFH